MADAVVFFFSPICVNILNLVYNNFIVDRHKNRLIVMTMFDSQTPPSLESPDIECLRQYMRRYTCLPYGEGDWLNRLLYKLPINRIPSDSESDRSIVIEHGALIE